MANNFVIGVQTKVYFGLLPQSILALDNPTAPPDVIVTASANANQGAGSISVEALTGAIAAGTPVRFGSVTEVALSANAAKDATSLSVTALTAAIPAGSVINFLGGDLRVVTTAAAASSATTITIAPLAKALTSGAVGYRYTGALNIAYLTADAASGATSLSVEPLGAAIAADDVALHKGLLLLAGGTQAQEQIDSTDTTTTIFGDELPYATGAVTGASWNISYNFNVLPSDVGYGRLKYAAVNALRGARGWVKKVDPAPAGFSTGETIEGLCDITGWSTDNGADAIITGQATFTGRGKPQTARIAA